MNEGYYVIETAEDINKFLNIIIFQLFVSLC